MISLFSLSLSLYSDSVLLCWATQATSDPGLFCSFNMPDSFWFPIIGYRYHHLKTDHGCWEWLHINSLKIYKITVDGQQTMKITLDCNRYDHFCYDDSYYILRLQLWQTVLHSGLHQWAVENFNKKCNLKTIIKFPGCTIALDNCTWHHNVIKRNYFLSHYWVSPK